LNIIKNRARKKFLEKYDKVPRGGGFLLILGKMKIVWETVTCVTVCFAGKR
jgi:hypothetical protein